MNALKEIFEKYGMGISKPYEQEDKVAFMEYNKKWNDGQKRQALHEFSRGRHIIYMKNEQKLYQQMEVPERYRKVTSVCFEDLTFKLLYQYEPEQQVESSIQLSFYQHNPEHIQLRTIKNDVYNSPEKYGLSEKQLEFTEMFSEKDVTEEKANQMFSLSEEFISGEYMERGLVKLCDEIRSVIKDS